MVGQCSRRWSLAFGLGLWLASAVVVYAQQPTGLRLEKHADSMQATPGDRLGFTLILTNEGSDELTGLVVSDITPAGTVFFGAAGPRDWMITTPGQGQEGQVFWRSTAALGPGKSVELVLLVNVRAESEETLTSQGFTVQAAGWNAPVEGPALTIPVVKPAATPAPGWTERAMNRSPVWLIVGGLLILLSGVVALGLGLRQRAGR
jgi:uncharacterized repeat protein (TIGR01451 family)